MKKMSKRAKWITGSISAVLAIILVFVGIYTYRIYHSLDTLNKDPGQSIFTNNSKEETVQPPKWTGTERVNILLMGGDSRGLKKNEVPRSDSLMVASVDPVTKKGTLFSILRDTYVEIPGHGKERINTALAIGGPNLAMKTVGDLLDIPIQYYVYVDFKGFIALIDAIGGVDFNVEKDMKYSSNADKHEYDIDLKKGMQHLDGKSALQYVRFRHDAMSDFSRTERQREFLQAVATKMKSTWSIMKLPDILEQVNPFIETNLSVDDMWKLAALGYDSQLSSSEQIPPMNLIGEENAGGAAVIGIKDEQKLKDFVQETFAKETAPPPVTKEGTGTGTGSGTSTDQTKSDTNTSTKNNSNSKTSK